MPSSMQAWPGGSSFFLVDFTTLGNGEQLTRQQSCYEVSLIWGLRLFALNALLSKHHISLQCLPSVQG